MENKLLKLTNDENLTIDSREVAEMMNKEHKDIMRMIDGYEPPEGSTKNRIVGILPTLAKGNFTPCDYFIETTYLNNNRKYKCYLCTKMGCEMLGNKLQGEKGILFTAKYVNRFNLMEQSIKENQILVFTDKIESLEDTVNKFERLTEEAKRQYKPSHKMKLDYSKMIRTLTNNDEDYQAVRDWCFGLLNITKWEDSCIDDAPKVMEIIKTVSRLIAINKFEQLSMF